MPAPPRMETTHDRPSRWSTVRPGTHWSASGMQVAPERRMSSAVRTNTAAGALESSTASRPTEVTSTLKSSSMPTLSKSSVGTPTCCAGQVPRAKAKATRNEDVLTYLTSVGNVFNLIGEGGASAPMKPPWPLQFRVFPVDDYGLAVNLI